MLVRMELLGVIVVVGFIGLSAWVWWRRAVPVTPLSADEAATLAAALPQWPRLGPAQRQRLLEHTAAFLQHKDFYGCKGLELTRPMALRIAALACLLTLRRDAPPYPDLQSVLVYPEPFLVRDPEPDELGIVHDEAEVRIGESWDAQRIVLSWPDVEAAFAGAPVNVVVHECAHQLDPLGQGRPEGTDPQVWAAVMQPAYVRLQTHGSPVIDDYGRESPAEFFAVVCESYVQEPQALLAAHPEIYRTLDQVFQLDQNQAPA